MPATAGRVRMPANNRVHSSAALQTHGIWQSAIGYDPYAPTNKEDKKDSSQQKTSGSEPDTENAYANFQGLLALARITGSNNDVDRGACKKCGRVGHLKFQCKNLVKIKDEFEGKDTESDQLPVLAALDKLSGKLTGNTSKVDGKNMRDIPEASDEDDDSESSDSDEDPDIERIIAERYGKKLGIKKVKSRKKRESDEDGSDTDSGKKRGRSKHRRRKESDDSYDSGEHRRNKKKEKRRKRSESSGEDDERRRRHRKSRKEKRRRRSYQSESSDSDRSEDSGRRRRHRSRRQVSSSDSDSSGSDDRRTGRRHKRAAGKNSSRRHGD